MSTQEKPEELNPKNVIDYYRYWTTDAIIADLDTKRHDFSVLITNKFHDFNIGSVIRNANAFMAKEVIVWGRKQFDKRGTVGAHHYSNLKFVKETEDLDLDGCLVIGFDNMDGAEPLEEFSWEPEEGQHIVLAFGQEQTGLPDEIVQRCDHIVYISQYGSTRSLNVGCASAIAMYDLCSNMFRRPLLDPSS
jgi:tRNA G18 (ribose-2'-O)-methylase SpoU